MFSSNEQQAAVLLSHSHAPMKCPVHRCVHDLLSRPNLFLPSLTMNQWQTNKRRGYMRMWPILPDAMLRRWTPTLRTRFHSDLDTTQSSSASHRHNLCVQCNRTIRSALRRIAVTLRERETTFFSRVETRIFEIYPREKSRHSREFRIYIFLSLVHGL